MSTTSRRRTVTLRDGARVTLRPIAPEDAPLVAASFERLSKESRYRRLLTHKDTLTADEVAYLVNVDHQDHEAIIAIDPTNGDALGVARYIRSETDPEVAEVAVTVADDWQRRGLGRALLARLTYRARREGVRRFSAFVLTENPGAVKLLTDVGEPRWRDDAEARELIADLPPQRGMGAQLAKVLRAAASGSVVPAKTLASRIALGVAPAPSAPPQPQRPMRTIVARADDPETGERTLAVAVGLGAVLGAALHVVSADGASLEAAARSASAQGLQAVTHARRDDPAEALIAVAEEQDADLIVVGDAGMSSGARFLLGSVPDRVSHHAPCSVLIVRAG